jgi:DNA-binding CsgD family transcriptional regulator
MGNSSSVRGTDIRAAMRLVGECRDFGRDPTAWRLHAFKGLHGLIGACAANGGEMYWPGRQGPIQSILPVETGSFTERERGLYYEYMKTHGPNHPVVYETFKKMKGPISSSIRTHQIDRDLWERSNFQAMFVECGIGYNMVSLFELEGASTMNVIALHRQVGERDFNLRERNLLHLVHDELSRLIGPVLKVAGVTKPKRLPPRVQQTLDYLLQGDSEKQVALRLGLSRATVHQYVTDLYRRFGVHTRAELLAKFVR